MRSVSKKRSNHANILLAAISSFALASGSAQAQSSNASDDSAEMTVNEITVTAQRRNEALQDVPISIHAFSEETLKNANVRTITDLMSLTPGLQIQVDATYVNPRLRGVGAIAASVSIENSVATYIDGVYLRSGAGGNFSFNNISNIEVDKGPQGTLFGRNATAGLIQITTRDPQEAFRWSGSVSYGNYDTFGGDFYATGGIAPDLAADISGYISYQSKGYGKNAFTGKDINRTRDYAARSKWILTPSDRTKIKFSVDVQRTDGVPQLIPAPGATPAGGVPYTGPRQGMNAYYQPWSRVDAGGTSLRIEQDLGFANLMSLTAYRHTDLEIFYDSFTTDPLTTINLRIVDQNDGFSQEFQLQSLEGSWLKWTTGVFLYYDKAQYKPVDLYDPFFAPFDFFRLRSKEITKSAAIYGQAAAEILPETNLTAGFRYTVESRTATSAQFLEPGSVELGGDRRKLSVERPTWRLSLDHRFSPQVMAYISYNRGFKSGGFNHTELPLLPFKPETLDAYEIGLKTQTSDRALSFNVAGFYYDFKNIQTVIYPVGSAIVLNGPSAKIYGLDADLTARIGERLTITAGAEILHSEYGSFPNAPVSTPLPGGGVVFTTGDAKGRSIALAPDNTFTLSANYDLPVAFGTFKLNVNYAHNGRWFAGPDHRLSQKPYDIVNGQIAFSPDDESWKVRLWAKNLFDEEYFTVLGSQAASDYAGYAPPRTFGITLEKPF
jgi:iron complex outermembrane receptor protein